MNTTDDLRISALRELVTPQEVIAAHPLSDEVARTVTGTRAAIHEILNGKDDRLLVVVGPCSIHDPGAALTYARRLAEKRDGFRNELEIVMRVYFEKPRTTIGWKGLINDPHLDGSFDINGGLHRARELLVEINAMGLPAACEFLDTTTPQYIADLVAWGAIGARTTESQIHRQMASGLSCPVGFKNGTSGDIGIAIDAIRAAASPHHFLAVTKSGQAAIAETTGNADGHIILRGGSDGPNHDGANVAATAMALEKAGLAPSVMIDASHANSGKDFRRQPQVLAEIGTQIANGDPRITGVMIESFLIQGRQDLRPGFELAYGQSITDGCINWHDTMRALEGLADAVTTRRARMQQAAEVA